MSETRTFNDPNNSAVNGVSKTDGGTFVWADHPGQSKHGYEGWPDLTAYEGDWDFAVKAINGNQQCEVKFHARMKLQNGNWEVNWWRKQ